MTKTISPPTCFCGSPSHLDTNDKIYSGRTYGNGMIWLCDRYPECRGSVGCHPDSTPFGTIPDPETKAMRRKLHSIVDPLWEQQTWRPKKKARGSVYGWLRHILDLTPAECHIGMFDKADCERALAAIAANPYEVRKPEGVS